MKREGKQLRRGPVFLASILLLALALAAGGTMAWLAAGSGGVRNDFGTGKVNIEVEETFEGDVKSNVRVTNTGTVEVYIRAAVVATWEDQAGNPLAIPVKPGDVKYTNFPGDGWTQGSDGYYYYTQPVSANKTTGNLIGEATVPGATAEQVLNLQILAEAIQAGGKDGNGTPVVESVWPVEVSTGGSLSIS